MKKQETLNKFSVSFFAKMAAGFVFSVPVLSIIVSYSFSALKMQLQQVFGYNIDKKYMFLLCNGILVLIAKNSGLISKPQSQSPQETDISISQNVKETRGKPGKVVKFADIKKPILEEKFLVEVEAAEETENLSLVPVNADYGSSIAQDEEIEEDENQCLINGDDALSTEELNKKCDDFIRKMKKEIKLEAQQVIYCY